ncbi:MULTISPECIES: acetyltransferase [Trichocoleus]|uniref:Acetyltransferase n=1 Tax=Trichocoleus desertorum GB2-A4 TaxID=2933944 RepID=A0ABV0J2M8_9CYAN|nr:MULTISPECIES: acetyltransferase [unclassified Trichocoleus]MBD1860130.1 acetyltransferase [Trichocoleus sp. FACHB-46]MBD2094572.1 acetyltransferase [Trichocoleus sp. FACHB-591]MBD2120138.1 acetyltransferase [Trichocoleus sp. FACHB-262]
MFLKQQNDDALIEVISVEDLANPMHDKVQGRIQDGQEEQDPKSFAKTELIFPSGESLPRCWLDSHYRENTSPAAMAS